MSSVLKPMRGVAPTKPLTDFPYLVSPKIDGLRALVKDGVVYSKTMKPIPNQQVQALFGHLHGADGELTVGPDRKTSLDDDVFDRSRGPIMRKDCEADFQFWIFDRWDCPNRSAYQRIRFHAGIPASWKGSLSWRHTSFIHHGLVVDQERLDYEISRALDAGYEGLMLRRPDAPYKYGQSTEKEGYLLKLKPFKDADAVILGVIEQQTNTNEATTDALGYTKRSSAKAGKIGKGTFGAFLVRDLVTGAEFSVGNGPGLTTQMRDDLWAQRAELPGKYITYKYQEIGTKDAPRLPQFLRFRDATDISEVGE